MGKGAYNEPFAPAMTAPTQAWCGARRAAASGTPAAPGSNRRRFTMAAKSNG